MMLLISSIEAGALAPRLPRMLMPISSVEMLSHRCPMLLRKSLVSSKAPTRRPRGEWGGSSAAAAHSASGGVGARRVSGR
eukprot:1919598-Prymnesium_polylepis.1